VKKSAASFSLQLVGKISAAVLSIVMGAGLGAFFLTLKPVVKLASDLKEDALALDEIFVAQPWVENTLNSWTKLRDVRLSDSSLSFNM
jgi:hypothetical protein